MSEKFEELVLNDKSYKLICNLNVMESIQEKYGSFNTWSNLCGGDNDQHEINITALKFGFLQMLNEAILMENEENNTNKELLTEKQVGRLVSKYGLLESSKIMVKAITNGVGVPKEKNA